MKIAHQSNILRFVPLPHQHHYHRHNHVHPTTTDVNLFCAVDNGKIQNITWYCRCLRNGKMITISIHLHSAMNDDGLKFGV